jgi:ABC-type branched-subunit amino acid transport system ATPase component
VARALSANVRLLLLDEPFEGLAPAVVEELFTVFDRLRQKVSIIIVEHNLDLVLALADRVFALERGAVFHEGPSERLLVDLEYRKQVLWLANAQADASMSQQPKTVTESDRGYTS